MNNLSKAIYGAVIAFATLATANPAAAGRYQTLDDLFYKVASEAEGFAGAWYTDDGALNIAVKPRGRSLTATEQKRALGALVDVFGKGGIELGLQQGGRCTLGLNAWIPIVWWQEPGFITAGHCGTFGDWSADWFTQPAGEDADIIAAEHNNPGFFGGDDCPSDGCRYSDSALVKYDAGDVARHPLPVAGSFLLVLVLAGGIATTSWQANIAASERAAAEAALATSDTVQEFLRSMLIAADPREGEQSVTMRAAMDRAAARVDAELGREPAVEARVREVIGMTYRTLGAYGEADVHLTRANDLAQVTFGASPDAMRIEHELAVLRWDQGRNDEALLLAQDTLNRQAHLLGLLFGECIEGRTVRVRRYGIRD